MRKWAAYFCALTVVCMLNTSCGVLNPPRKHNGYYIGHYTSCGPEAIEKALTHYASVNNITYKRSHSAKDISVRIQDRTSTINLRSILTVLDRDSAQITWPGEIVQELNSHGIKVRVIRDIKQMDKAKDTAIVLVHKRGYLNLYHWICYPVETVHHFGNKTVIDKIYILEK